MVAGARALGDSEANVARYARARERQTRSTALKLWTDEDYPWCEAMKQAWEKDMAVFWAATMTPNAFGLQVSIPGITDTAEGQQDAGGRGSGSRGSGSQREQGGRRARSR